MAQKMRKFEWQWENLVLRQSLKIPADIDLCLDF